jgi:hypothetical protein
MKGAITRLNVSFSLSLKMGTLEVVDWSINKFDHPKKRYRIFSNSNTTNFFAAGNRRKFDVNAFSCYKSDFTLP